MTAGFTYREAVYDLDAVQVMELTHELLRMPPKTVYAILVKPPKFKK